MSDEHGRDPGPDEEGTDSPEEGEEGGLGLTEEFARIESEIEQELGGSDRSADEEAEGEGGEEREPIEPGVVRFDETDSTEFVAPVPPRAAAEDTGEWETPDAEDEPEVAGAESEPEAADPEDELKPDREPEAEDEGPGADPAQDPPTVIGKVPDGVHGDAVPDDPPPPAQPAAPQGEESATEHTVVRPRPLVPIPATAGFDDAAVEAKTPSLFWRFATASILIVISTATAVALSALLFLTDVAADLQPIPGVQDELDAVEPGEPQTIMILGSDERADTPGDPGRSDTTLLLRVDAQNQVLSLFSLPRDLKVTIPGIGVDKLNAAYTAGGPELTLQTVKELLDIPISHVVNVDFQGFADAVNAIDCVYVDVDRDYFNDNSDPTMEQYATIDVNAGYQRLCGLNALDYVRYRHFDTDIVRAARQQDFLREARQKIQPRELLLDGTGNDLIEVFTKYTSSDLDDGDAGEVINLLKSFINVRDVPIKEVHFEGNLADVDESGIAYVTATDEQLDKAKEEFLGEEDSAGARGGEGANERSGSGDGESGEKKAKQKDPTSGANVISTEEAAAIAGVPDKFAAFGRTSARRLNIPVYAPTKVVPGSVPSDGSRQYEIKDDENEKHAAYKMVIELTAEDTIPEYYGIQGTAWTDPPILENPSDTIDVDGRSFDVYYDGDRLRMVAWRDEEGNSYWLQNTLLQTLDEDEMLAIAASTEKAQV